MSQRKEFVKLAQDDQANMRELSRRFGISPTTHYMDAVELLLLLQSLNA